MRVSFSDTARCVTDLEVTGESHRSGFVSLVMRL